MSVSTSPTGNSLLQSTVVSAREIAPGYLQVAFDNPPFNLFTPTVFAGLNLLREYVEDPANGVKVVVFESANSDFFIAHLDFASIGEVPDLPGAQNIIEGWPDFSHWLSTTPVVSIAKIRGRTRGIGNELVVACDMRFASRERARLAQIEVGFGVLPGGGGLEWLPQHAGRARALEIVLGADDFDAATAETYGWINRALADDALDGYVDRLARRIASFEATAIATVKQLLNQRTSPPSVEQLRESFNAILKLSARDEAKAIAAALRAKAGGSLGPRELDLPALYGQD